MEGILEAYQYSYCWTLREPPVSVSLNFLRPPDFRTVRLSESPVFIWFEYKTSSGFREFGLFKVPGFRTVGLLEALRYLYVWTLRGTPVFVWLDSQRPFSFPMVGS